MEKELLMPYTHILKAPSKEKRKSIPMAFNFWLDIPKEKAKFISDYVYMIHTASLIASSFSDNILEAFRGQGKEIYWRDNFQCPTEEHNNKTDYSHLAKLLGTYFQLIDDYCNITKTEALEEWTGADKNQEQNSQYFYEDLTEGKFTLPIIHAAKQNGGEAIENFGGNPELSAILDEMASNI
ncbi:unnamed protein product [Leptidea sinapis]|uniref:Uncharacterized protein n=1 Tax=Leptidea sinapis TaxID=189913 RepID=A0A5E4QKS2_9NEOP|nr:unnamed protein product [Leptidea sinapis]